MKRLLFVIWSAAAMPPLFGSDFQWRLPPGFPLPVAGANVQTEAKFQLGRKLFYDRRLSLNATQSCGDCHQQRFAFSDGRARATGSTGQQHSRNTMTLTNVAYNTAYTWENIRIRSLEQQARIPMFNEHPVELGWKGDEILARLRGDPAYVAMFRDGGERITVAGVTNALAAFERALISGRSSYDRLVYSGEEGALSPAAWRGMGLFFSERTTCSSCHQGFNFSGEARYVGKRDRAPQLVSNGVTEGQFRVPTLRNVALTAPYMHDGSFATLAEVIEKYSHAKNLRLSDAEKRDLLAFLEALTDPSFVTDPRFGPDYNQASHAPTPPRGDRRNRTRSGN